MATPRGKSTHATKVLRVVHRSLTVAAKLPAVTIFIVYFLCMRLGLCSCVFPACHHNANFSVSSIAMQSRMRSPSSVSSNIPVFCVIFGELSARHALCAFNFEHYQLNSQVMLVHVGHSDQTGTGARPHTSPFLVSASLGEFAHSSFYRSLIRLGLALCVCILELHPRFHARKHWDGKRVTKESWYVLYSRHGPLQ